MTRPLCIDGCGKRVPASRTSVRCGKCSKCDCGKWKIKTSAKCWDCYSSAVAPVGKCSVCQNPTSEFVGNRPRGRCQDCADIGIICSRYSITRERYLRILKDQGYACAICKRPPTTTRRMSVDHDHECCSGPKSCGKCVRALLCGGCNKALGYVNDSISRLHSMIEYVNEWKKSSSESLPEKQL